MTGEWNPPDRHVFDDGLAAHLATVFPEAQQEWVENHRRLLLAFPDSSTCTIYEPNFYFCLGNLWTAEQLFARAADAVAGQHRTLQRGEVI
jgi:hypothetical protein